MADTCDASNPLQQHDSTSGKTTDLVVSGPCEVKGSTNPSAPLSYYFHSVNVINKGALSFDDAHINFYAENIVVEYGGSLTAGTTTAPIGTADGLITIHLWGAPADPGVACTQTNCGIPTPPWGDNTQNAMDASRCDTSSLIPGVAKDCFYNYDTLDASDRNAGLTDRYFGHKVLALSFGGTIQLYGKKGATYESTSLTGCAENTPSCTGTSWVRLSKDALPGDTSIQVAGQINWQPNDQIVLSSTDYLPGHAEQLTITGTPTYNEGGNFTTIALGNSIQYPHNGQLFDLSNASYEGISRLGPNFRTSADMRAAVGLLSRSIRIVSDGDSPGENFAVNPGNPDNFFGGHTIVRQGFQSYQVQGVEFYQLGQGGSIMHYPLHFHMARQTPEAGANMPPLTFIKDTSVWDSMTRWIVIHATQGVRLARNVGYESIGHGFYLEDGTETGNQIYANLGVFARAAIANGPATPNVQQNPRMVPGILTSKDTNCDGTMAKCPSGYSNFPIYSDSQNPSVFWIMNGMNDFQYNMAAGAATCGACYWLLPGAISGPSQNEHWFGYAGEQLGTGRAGTSPLQNFVGNSCSSAQEGFIEVGSIAACNGVNQVNPDTLATKNSTLMMLPSPTAPPTTDTTYWPNVSGLRVPTRCKDVDNGTDPMADCSGTQVCSSDNEANCDVVVLDKFATSFNWAETNFAAVWMRSLWSLSLDSVISDPQNAGINFVTSGGYDVSSVFPGYWGLVRRNALIGSSQWGNPKYTDGLAVNPYTSNAGPANPFSAKIGTSTVKGLVCAPAPNDTSTNIPNNAYCLSQSDGVSFQEAAFSGFQRLFSVYDGPIFQDSNAFLNVHPTFFTDNGKVDGKVLVTSGGQRCQPAPLDTTEPSSNPCQFAGFISGGLPSALAYRATDTSQNRCFEPNAAIGWKQPNGFYYAPAFHSNNLFFSGVDIRHFVTDPFFTPGAFSFTTDTAATNQAYCYWNDAQFQGFTDIDRETVLNDDDGTLTGLTSPIGQPTSGVTLPTGVGLPSENLPSEVRLPQLLSRHRVLGRALGDPPVQDETISVNKEDFFDAPTQAWECASDYPANSLKDSKCLPATAKTSPYHYVSTVVYPECAVNAPPPPENGSPAFCPNATNWGSVCTSSPPNFGCPGVQLYRQLLLPDEQPGLAQLKRMMGQNNFQRSGLTANHGSYYINTNVSASQVPSGFESPNIFVGGQSYDLFFLYTHADTQQTYQMYVGQKGTPTVTYGYESLKLPFTFTQASAADIATGAWDSNYVSGTGLLTLTTNMSKIARIYDLTAPISGTVTLGQKYCQPATMCTWNNSADRCQCNTSGPYASLCNQTDPAGQTVCDWSVKDLDCPAQGCPAFRVAFPGVFVADGTDHRPPTGVFSFANTASFNWDVDFNLEPSTIAGQQCTYSSQPAAVDACPAVNP